MIALEQLKELFENELNKQGAGVNFKLHADTGKFLESERNYNSITPTVNGIFSSVTSNMETTVDGLNIVSMTAKVELLVPCKDEEDNTVQRVEYASGAQEKEIILGNAEFINGVRHAVDKVCEKNGIQTLSDIDGAKYVVSYTFSLAGTGVRAMDSLAGDYFTFTIYADYIFIKGGVNSRTIKLVLNGNSINYSNATIRRVPTQEAAVSSGEKIAKSLTSDTTLAVTAALPATEALPTQEILKYLIGGENLTHLLFIQTPYYSGVYLVQFGETSGTATGVLNAGLTLSIVEAPARYELLNIAPKLYIYEATSTRAATLTAAAAAGNQLFDFGKKRGYFDKGEGVLIDLTKGFQIISTQAIINPEANGLTLIRAGA